ncbi:MAG: hypothetical protein G01um101466_111 [Parcubacteria group bacterium Gr01-1014_66]|nr:MAG: hypothetical protein G01um101466_111 [Parcubacteria group bacterium Gr01-1014_66]
MNRDFSAATANGNLLNSFSRPNKLKRPSGDGHFNLPAGAEGIEPPIAVLETAVIPLN